MLCSSKKGKKENLGNYRLIRLTSNDAWKESEPSLFRNFFQDLQWQEDNQEQLTRIYQRANHAWPKQMYSTMKWLAMEARRKQSMLHLVFSEPFDTLSHSTLNCKLKKYYKYLQIRNITNGLFGQPKTGWISELKGQELTTWKTKQNQTTENTSSRNSHLNFRRVYCILIPQFYNSLSRRAMLLLWELFICHR